jgi:putative membrane protein
MRSLIRHWFLYILTLFLLDQVFSFITIANTTTLLAAGTALYVLNTIGRPILKILWLPINLITLGLFSWVINILVVFLVVLFIPGFSLALFDTPTLEFGRFIIPALHLKLFWTYFAFSFMLSWGVSILGWLLVGE